MNQNPDSKAGEKPGHYAYLVECRDGTYYCGYTNNLEKRIKTHNAGKGGKYTRRKRPVRLAYFEKFSEKGEAMSREAEIKKLSREEKERLVHGIR